MAFILMSLSFVLMLVSIGGAVVAYRNWQKIKKVTSPVASVPEQAPQNYYGHPFAPVPALRKRLPRLPGGYQWETKVLTEPKNGHYYLHLTLVDIMQNTNVSTRKFDLTESWMFPSLHHTWAREYRSYSTDYGKNTIFKDELIGTMVDWAILEAAKLDTTEVRDYHLGDK